jgi:hypothetical protein
VADKSDKGGESRGGGVGAVGGGDGDSESRLDRELIELLQELRVILPGVQVLFAFLLTVPFSQRFGATTSTERAVFFVAFMATTTSAVLLMVPGVWHRLRFRDRDKEDLIRGSTNLTIAATVALAIAMIAVVFLLAEVLYGLTAGIVTASVVGVVIVVLWYVSPLWDPLERRISGRGGA